jgi:hypothetical protein
MGFILVFAVSEPIENSCVRTAMISCMMDMWKSALVLAGFSGCTTSLLGITITHYSKFTNLF